MGFFKEKAPRDNKPRYPTETQAPMDLRRNSIWAAPQPAVPRRNMVDPRIRAALEIPFSHIDTEDPDQLKWIIDQMVQKLHERPQDYQVWVMMYERQAHMPNWTQGKPPR